MVIMIQKLLEKLLILSFYLMIMLIFCNPSPISLKEKVDVRTLIKVLFYVYLDFPFGSN